MKCSRLALLLVLTVLARVTVALAAGDGAADGCDKMALLPLPCLDVLHQADLSENAVEQRDSDMAKDDRDDNSDRVAGKKTADAEASVATDSSYNGYYGDDADTTLSPNVSAEEEPAEPDMTDVGGPSDVDDDGNAAAAAEEPDTPRDADPASTSERTRAASDESESSMESDDGDDGNDDGDNGDNGDNDNGQQRDAKADGEESAAVEQFDVYGANVGASAPMEADGDDDADQPRAKVSPDESPDDAGSQAAPEDSPNREPREGGDKDSYDDLMSDEVESGVWSGPVNSREIVVAWGSALSRLADFGRWSANDWRAVLQKVSRQFAGIDWEGFRAGQSAD